MIGIDTNVLLRVFVRDDLLQHAAARKLVADHAESGLFVSIVVLSELVRVLRRRLRRTITETLEIVERLVEAPEFVIEAPSIVEDAIRVYRAGNTEFSDCLIVAIAKAAGASPLYTFDREAAKDIPGAALLAS